MFDETLPEQFLFNENGSNLRMLMHNILSLTIVFQQIFKNMLKKQHRNTLKQTRHFPFFQTLTLIAERRVLLVGQTPRLSPCTALSCN